MVYFGFYAHCVDGGSLAPTGIGAPIEPSRGA